MCLQTKISDLRGVYKDKNKSSIILYHIGISSSLVQCQRKPPMNGPSSFSSSSYSRHYHSSILASHVPHCCPLIHTNKYFGYSYYVYEISYISFSLISTYNLSLEIQLSQNLLRSTCVDFMTMSINWSVNNIIIRNEYKIIQNCKNQYITLGLVNCELFTEFCFFQGIYIQVGAFRVCQESMKMTSKKSFLENE